MNTLVVTCADSHYLNQAKQLFSSLYFTNQWSFDVMLITDSIQEKEWFTERGIQVREFAIPVKYTEGPAYKSTYLKFNIFTKEFKRWDKIIYLDTDIIVVGDISGLLDCKGFNACRDPLNLSQQFHKLPPGISPDANAFNAGVLVFDTCLISDTTFSELLTLNDTLAPSLIYQEQSILNLYFYGRWNPLPHMYNYHPYTHRFSFPEPLFDCRDISVSILHFFGKGRKPWFPDSPYFGIYNDFLKKSEVIDFRKKNAPRNCRFRIGLLGIRNKIYYEYCRLGWFIKKRFLPIDNSASKS